MSYLLIDTGNSYSKFAFYHSQQLTDIMLCQTSDLIQSIQNLKQSITFKKIILVSVVDENTTSKLIADLKTVFSTDIMQVKTSTAAFGVTCGYPDYSLLGADRWVALVAAHNLLQTEIAQPLMVIDCGTVITVDMLDANGQHLGGWMMPSTKLMTECLQVKSSAIETGFNETGHTLTNENSAKIGQSTKQCVALGTQLAETGFIEQCIHQGRELSGESLRIIFTGGGAESISNKLSFPIEYEPNLVVLGLTLFIE